MTAFQYLGSILLDKTPLGNMYERRMIKRYNITRGLERAEPSAVVMTDYMDTLAHRSISIVEVLKLWSSTMGERFNIDSKLIEKHRLEIAYGPMHCTVPPNVVYGMIADKCIALGALDMSQREDFCIIAHEVEIDIELKTQSVISSTLEYLLAAKEHGTRIVCVTDLRLSADDVRTMLETHGVLHIFDYIISSADIGLTKKNGGLYDYALKLIGASPADCLMIGDSLHSDCINATMHGIRACWVA